MNLNKKSLEDLARLVQGECIGQSNLVIQGLSSLDQASPQNISIETDEK